MSKREETKEELESRLWVEDGLVDKLCKDMYGHSNWQFWDLDYEVEGGGTCIYFHKESQGTEGWEKLSEKDYWYHRKKKLDNEK